MSSTNFRSILIFASGVVGSRNIDYYMGYFCSLGASVYYSLPYIHGLLYHLHFEVHGRFPERMVNGRAGKMWVTCGVSLR